MQPETPESPRALAVEVLEQTLELMDFDASVEEATEDDGILRIIIGGEDAELLAAHNGQSLAALQYLLTLVLRRQTGEYIRLIVDAAGYRSRRDDELVGLAQRIAAQAKRTGQEAVLDPLNPYERRVVHNALTDDPEVETYSEGEEPERCVVISPIVAEDDDLGEAEDEDEADDGFEDDEDEDDEDDFDADEDEDEDDEDDFDADEDEDEDDDKS